MTCTASATHHEHLIRRLGASNAVDRHSPQLVEDLIWGGPYDAFIDCVATERTVGMLKEVAWRTSAKNKAIEILTLRPVQETKCDSKKIGTMETVSSRLSFTSDVTALSNQVSLQDVRPYYSILFTFPQSLRTLF